MLSERRRPRRQLRCLIEAVEPRTLLTTYYVSPGGNDTNSGTSSGAPWKSIAKINQLDLNAGDKVLFQGGSTFNAAANSSTNLVGDSGFESGNLNSWTLDFGNASITSTASEIKSGSKALKIAGDTDGGRGQQIGSKVKANKSYQLKMWAKLTSGTGQAYGGVTFYKAGVEVAVSSFKIVGSTYKEYASSFAAPPSFDSARIWVTKDGGTSVLNVDDVKLNETYGTIILDASDSGTASNPVKLGSYGSGRATFNAGDGHGLFAYNISGFEIEDLVFAGTWDGLAATGTNSGNGITLTNRLTDNTKLSYIRIDNVEARNFKWAGISVSGDMGKSGYNDVRITNSSAHDNGDVGIRVEGTHDQASTLWAHSDVYIGWCKAYNNGGLPNKMSNSGNGILIGDVDGGVIERSVAWNNGQNCNHTSGGPVGIWAWDSTEVTIQYNESYGNKTGTGSLDGGGFDLDGGVTNSVMQYNYSHDNDGAGYLMYQFSNARAFGNNAIRYNISQNDGRDGHYGGIYIGGGSAVANNDIYGNTIYLAPGADSDIAAVKLTGVGSNNKFRNNIFYTTSGVRLLESNSAYSTSNVQFQGNAWYGSGGFSLKWGSTTYSDLSSWRSTGQEKNGSTLTGSSSNPQLVSAGNGPTLGDASKLYKLTQYQLLSGSPAINAGVNLNNFGISTGGKDFFGSSTYAGSNYDAGAFESNGSISGTSGDDEYVIRLGANNTVELYAGSSASGDPIKVWAKNVYPNFTVNGNGGDDTLTLDLSNGNPLTSGGATFKGGTSSGDHDVLVIDGTSANDTVSVTASSVTPAGSSTGLNYVAVGEVIVDAGSGDDTLVYSTPATEVEFLGGGGSNTININSGTYIFDEDAANTTPELHVNVAAAATAVFTASQHLGSLTVAGNAMAAQGGQIVIVTDELDVIGNGSLDIKDNTIIVDYDTLPNADTESPIGDWTGDEYDGLSGALARAYGTGDWTGPGIKSSTANDGQGTFGVGIGESKDIFYLDPGATASLAGEIVDDSAVVIRFTYAGDADMNGIIDGDDYHRIDSSLPANLTGFTNGDLNYDGVIDGDDVFFLDSNYLIAAGTPLREFSAVSALKV